MSGQVTSVEQRRASWGVYWIVKAIRDGTAVELQFNQDQPPGDEQIAAQMEADNAPLVD